MQLGHAYPIQTCETRVLYEVNGGCICETVDYPIAGLIFEVAAGESGMQASPEVLQRLHACVEAMQSRKIAHNVCMLFGDDNSSGGGVTATAQKIRIFVFPRATISGVNQKGGLLDIAFMELAGHFTAFSDEAFAAATNAECARALGGLAVPEGEYRAAKGAALLRPGGGARL